MTLRSAHATLQAVGTHTKESMSNQQICAYHEKRFTYIVRKGVCDYNAL